MKDQSQQKEVGLARAFLIGAITPYATLFCSVSRKQKPFWLTKEFAESTKGLHQFVLGVGLMTGMSSMMSGAYFLQSYAIDKFLMSPSSHSTKEHPVKEVQEKKKVEPVKRYDRYYTANISEKEYS